MGITSLKMPKPKKQPRIYLNNDIILLKKQFRLLKKWKIYYIKDPKYYGQASIFPNKKIAYIYSYPPEIETPSDYILHEIIHCSIRELLHRMNGKKIIGKIREAEESFVIDLCELIKNGSVAIRIAS